MLALVPRLAQPGASVRPVYAAVRQPLLAPGLFLSFHEPVPAIEVTMALRARPFQGFTLIELMVTLSVLLILTLLALPSFISFRQRAAVRGSTEQVQSFWNQARFEAAKRNQMVKVGVQQSGANFCLGAATTTNQNDTTPCDCLAVAPTTNICDVASFPAADATFASQSEWRNVTFVVASGTTPSLGGLNNSVAVIEPKRTALTVSTQAGALTFAGPTGGKSYRVNMLVDRFGRAALCESNLAVDKMSDYTTRRCDP